MIVRFAKTGETFADLHNRLGEVPLDRIRMKPAPGTATEEDLRRARKPTCELVDGVLVEKPMGTRESLLAAYIIVGRTLLYSRSLLAFMRHQRGEPLSGAPRS
jgi:hypothetical protein